MAVVDYAVMNGRIVSETRGGARRYYKADALGSTVALYNDSQTKTDSFKYWPYGEDRSVSNPTGTKYKYVGTLGCRAQSDGGIYMRARVEEPQHGRWMTVDPLWPDSQSYCYVVCSPLLFVDPSGLQEVITPGGEGIAIGQAFICCAHQAKDAIAAASRFCRENGLGAPIDGGLCNAMQHCMWACLIAQNCGAGLGVFGGKQVALDCTNLHEEDAPFRGCPGYRPVPSPYRPNPPTHKCMDLYNNRVGIRCSSAVDCYSCCSRNAKGGGLQIVVPTHPLPKKWRPSRTDCKKNPKGVRMPPIDFEDN